MLPFSHDKSLLLFRAGSRKHTGRLNIYGPPATRPFPSDLKAVEGSEYILHCPVGGYPIEAVVWEKDGSRLTSDLRRKILTNGTMIIGNVVKEIEEGNYRCTATGRSGASDTTSTMLRVIGNGE